MHFSSRFFLALFLIIGLASASFVHGQSPAALDLSQLVRQLQEQIKLLQAQINELKSQVKSTREDVATTREEVKNIREELNITSPLRFGVSGGDVKKVQEFLSQFPDIYPEKLVTGFYGPRTEAAIRKFQARHGIEAIGVVGPKTLAKINEVIRQSAEAQEQENPDANFQAEAKPQTERKKPALAAPITPSLGTSSVPATTTNAVLPASGTATSSATATTSLSALLPSSPPPSSSQALATSTVVSPPPASTPTPASVTPSTTSAATTTTTSATAAADTTAPVISNLQATSTSPTSVVVTWTTNEPADSRVEYVLSMGYDHAGSSSDRVTAHSITIMRTSFEFNATYRYRVISKDAAGNAATSPENTFTVSYSDKTPPVISGLQAGNIGETGATISWTTDELATRELYYSASSPINTATASKFTSPILITNHTETIAGLSPATTYYYLVSLKDASGNTTTSSEESFTTTSPPALPSPIGHWPFDGNGNNAIAGGVSAVSAGGAQFRSEGGKFGGYAYIPASGDSIKIPYSSIFDLPNSFTIEFWFRQRSNQSAAQDLVYKGTPINNYNFRVFRQLWNENNFGPIITGYTAVNTGYWSQTSNPNQLSHGSWHHVAYTKDTSASAYYLDGFLTHRLDYAQYPEYSGPARTPALDIIIGGSAVDTDIDNLRIYSTGLTPGQVTQNMQTASIQPKTADTKLASIAATLARIAEEIKKLRGR